MCRRVSTARCFVGLLLGHKDRKKESSLLGDDVLHARQQFRQIDRGYPTGPYNNATVVFVVLKV